MSIGAYPPGVDGTSDYFNTQDDVFCSECEHFICDDTGENGICVFDFADYLEKMPRKDASAYLNWVFDHMYTGDAVDACKRFKQS